MVSAKNNQTVSVSDAAKRPVQRRRFTGLVISDRGDKTVVVQVDVVKKHPKYHKRYTVSRKYQVHDEKNEFKAGDRVMFVECRPLSRHKRWRVLGRLK